MSKYVCRRMNFKPISWTENLWVGYYADKDQDEPASFCQICDEPITYGMLNDGMVHSADDGEDIHEWCCSCVQETQGLYSPVEAYDEWAWEEYAS